MVVHGERTATTLVHPTIPGTFLFSNKPKPPFQSNTPPRRLGYSERCTANLFGAPLPSYIFQVYDRLPDGARPMPCPLFSESAETLSPLPSTPDALGSLARAVLEWGKAFSGGYGIRGGGIFSLAAVVSAAATAATTGVGEQDTPTEAETGYGSVVAAGGGLGRAASSAVTGVVTSLADEDTGVCNGAVSAGPSGEPVASGGVEGVGKSGRVGMSNTEERAEQRRGDCAPGEDGSRNSDGVNIGSNGHHIGDDVVPVSGGGHDKVALTVTKTPWGMGRFALEMQAPWARRLLDGDKTVETRSYPLPAELVGRSIELMESKPGQDGVSSLGDTVEALCPGLSVVGRVTFSSSEAYSSRDAWAADEPRHLVSPTSEGYGWKGPKSVFAWVVSEVTAYPKPRAVRRMKRALRSLFEVDQHRGGDTGGAGANVNVDCDDGGGAQQDGSSRRKKPKKKRKKRNSGGPSLAEVDGGEGLRTVGNHAAEAKAEAKSSTSEAVIGEEKTPAAASLSEFEKKRPRDDMADIPASNNQGAKNAAGLQGKVVQHDSSGGGGRWRAGGRRKKKKPRNEATGGERDRDLGSKNDGRSDGESRQDGRVDGTGTGTAPKRKNGDGSMGAVNKQGGRGSKLAKRKRF